MTSMTSPRSSARAQTRFVARRVAPTSFVTLGIRIPRSLRRRVRLHCAVVERTVESFVAEALSERLRARRRG